MRRSRVLQTRTKASDSAATKLDPLKLKNYNDLRGDHYVPRVLIVVLVPTVPEDWLIQNHESLALRHCVYWLSLQQSPETTNTAKVTVAIPRSQR